MKETLGRLLAVLGVVLPVAMVGYMVWFATTVCMPDWSADCPLVDLEGAVKGLVFVGTMLLAGGLLALAFSSFDRARGIGSSSARNGGPGGKH